MNPRIPMMTTTAPAVRIINVGVLFPASGNPVGVGFTVGVGVASHSKTVTGGEILVSKQTPFGLIVLRALILDR